MHLAPTTSCGAPIEGEFDTAAFVAVSAVADVWLCNRTGHPVRTLVDPGALGVGVGLSLLEEQQALRHDGAIGTPLVDMVAASPAPLEPQSGFLATLAQAQRRNYGSTLESARGAADDDSAAACFQGYDDEPLLGGASASLRMVRVNTAAHWRLRDVLAARSARRRLQRLDPLSGAGGIDPIAADNDHRAPTLRLALKSAADDVVSSLASWDGSGSASGDGARGKSGLFEDSPWSSAMAHIDCTAGGRDDDSNSWADGSSRDAFDANGTMTDEMGGVAYADEVGADLSAGSSGGSSGSSSSARRRQIVRLYAKRRASSIEICATTRLLRFGEARGAFENAFAAPTSHDVQNGVLGTSIGTVRGGGGGGRLETCAVSIGCDDAFAAADAALSLAAPLVLTTTLLSLAPRFVVFNRCAETLLVRQRGRPDTVVPFRPGQVNLILHPFCSRHA